MYLRLLQYIPYDVGTTTTTTTTTTTAATTTYVYFQTRHVIILGRATGFTRTEFLRRSSLKLQSVSSSVAAAAAAAAVVVFAVVVVLYSLARRQLYRRVCVC
jgi:hypothetical protein